jgi:hypothetical protein
VKQSTDNATLRRPAQLLLRPAAPHQGGTDGDVCAVLAGQHPIAQDEHIETGGEEGRQGIVLPHTIGFSCMVARRPPPGQISEHRTPGRGSTVPDIACCLEKDDI